MAYPWAYPYRVRLGYMHHARLRGGGFAKRSSKTRNRFRSVCIVRALHVNCKGPALCTLQAAPGKPIMADQILNCRFHEIKARPTFRCTLNPLLYALGGRGRHRRSRRRSRARWSQTLRPGRYRGDPWVLRSGSWEDLRPRISLTLSHSAVRLGSIFPQERTRAQSLMRSRI
jgi:hypothetical protein